MNEKLLKKYRNDSNEDQIMLKVLFKLNDCLSDENKNLSIGSAKENINKIMTDLSKKPEYDLSKDVIHQISKNECLIRSLLDIVSENNVPKKEIKVLEINLTNSLLAKEVDNHLASAAIYPIDVNYTIALKSTDGTTDDIKDGSFLLNEWNPKNSDFPTNLSTMNLIILRDCPELWHLKLESLIQEMHDSILEKGFLLCVFRCKYTEPELSLNSMNGKKHLNDSQLEQRIFEFEKTAKNIGFRLVAIKSESICYKTILFRKVELIPDFPKPENIIEIQTNSMQWFERLQNKLNQLKETEKRDDNIWLIATDSSFNGIIGLINCLRMEPGGETIRCLFDSDGSIKHPINFEVKPFSDILSNDLAINVFKNRKIGTLRHLTLHKGYDKTESEEYFLNIGQTRDLSGLQWFDLRNLKSPETLYTLNNQRIKQIKCNVYTAGLNFRDVMLATGLQFINLS